MVPGPPTIGTCRIVASVLDLEFASDRRNHCIIPTISNLGRSYLQMRNTAPNKLNQSGWFDHVMNARYTDN